MAHHSTPLSAYLDGPSVPAKAKKTVKNSRKMWIGALLLAFLPSLSTTFASSIAIGSPGPIEFGQGSQATAVCDSSILVAIGTEWSQNSSFFKATSITLGDLDTTSGHCLGKTLTVKALDSTGSEIDLNGATAGNALTLSGFSAGTDHDSKVLNISGTINSVDIARVTVETA
jgi:hypothetical protein